ncbi:hypothetical protein F0L68_15800 [Solihabitans fulvus]|uniref:Uncharacterized protein n=1 Tax=Solihabitans fulvus TaxID=1892852 RepID=A0A5B2XD79_9PSEU|nr:hypothetical protein [Solihabitans fulvus]KAA2261708.1 hypothetical protein F0L68_15800 [Solihabitans fulvus]
MVSVGVVSALEQLFAWGAGAVLAVVVVLAGARVVLGERAAGDGGDDGAAPPRPRAVRRLDGALVVGVCALVVLLVLRVVAGLP